MEINACSLRSCEREVWENFSRGERVEPRFGDMTLSFEFCALTRRFQGFVSLRRESSGTLALTKGGGSVKKRGAPTQLLLGKAR